MSSTMSSSAAFSLEQLSSSPNEQLCYVHCNFCDTILAVGVPCSSLFKTVTVRCGHCSNLFPVNLRGLLMPAAAGNQLHFGQSFLSPPHHGLLDEVPLQMTPPASLLLGNAGVNLSGFVGNVTPPPLPKPMTQEVCQPPKNISPPVNRPPEKRQRVPSAYNQFIKDEIQRIKAGNPDITHREAFSAAAKNWAHYPHIHFGLMPDQQASKKTSTLPQDGSGEDHMFAVDHGLYAAAAAAAAVAGHARISPF